MDSQILRFAQDDRVVLPAALGPTRAHARLRLMPIQADKSAVAAINRALQAGHARLRYPDSFVKGHYRALR